MGYRRNDIVRIQLPPAMFQTVLVLLLLSVLSMTSLACSPPQTGRTLAERIRYSKQARVVYGKVAAIYYENKDADDDEDRTDYAAASVQVYCSLMGNPVPPYINISLLGMLISQCILGTILYWLHWIVGIYIFVTSFIIDYRLHQVYGCCSHWRRGLRLVA